MNYKESEAVLKEIKSADKILLNCHKSPDPDSVGSALAMALVLKNLGKEVTVVCPDNISRELAFLPGSDAIKTINYADFDFSGFGLFIILDSASEDVITGSKDIGLPKVPIINIDHHKSNPSFGDINLINTSTSSVSELLFNLFGDWHVKLDKKIATCLYVGIVGDTGCFMYPGTNAKTHEVAAQLMELGADNVDVLFKLFRQIPIERMWQVGELFRNAKVDKQYKFVYSAIDNKIFVSLGADKLAKNLANALLFQNVKGTNFSVVIVEGEKNTLWVSLRSRVDGFDTTPIAIELGGGGNMVTSGATIRNIEFSEGVEKVLEVVRKHFR